MGVILSPKVILKGYIGYLDLCGCKGFRFGFDIWLFALENREKARRFRFYCI